MKKVLKFALISAMALGAITGCKDKDTEPTEEITGLTVNPPVVKDRNETVEATKLVYEDKVEITGVLDKKIGDKTEKVEVKKEATLKSEASWSATTTINSALAGETAVKATITASATGLTFDFGSFKIADAVKFTNPKYTFTESGKSAEMPLFGFNAGETSANAVVETKTVAEGGKNYTVTTVAQPFKIKHADGTLSKECSIKFERKDEITGPTLVGYEEYKSKFNATLFYQPGAYDYDCDINYTILRNYNIGAPEEVNITRRHLTTFSDLSAGDRAMWGSNTWDLKNPKITFLEKKSEGNPKLKDKITAQKVYVDYNVVFENSESGIESLTDGVEFVVRLTYFEHSYADGGLPELKLGEAPAIEFEKVTFKDKRATSIDGIPVEQAAGVFSFTIRYGGLELLGKVYLRYVHVRR